MTLVWALLGFTGVMAVVSLGVDLGRVQLAKTELRRTVDVAARYAATGVADNSYFNKAQVAATDNKVDGSTLTLLAGDVVVGNWDSTQTPKFSTTRTPVNAVQVNGKRVEARGTAIPTVFMKMLGVNGCDVTASAVAIAGNTSTFGTIGMQWVDLNSVDVVDSYDSRLGPYSAASAGEGGAVASNGSISLNSTTVEKDVYMLPGQTLSANSSSYGTRQTGSSISIPTPSAGAYATSNNNNLISPVGVVSGGNFDANNKSVTIPAGNYYFNKFDAKGGSLNVTGPATIYVNGDIHVHSGTAFNLPSNAPGNLTFKVVASSGAKVHFNSMGNIYADIQAPTADIHLNSTTAFFGRLIGKTIKLNSTDAMHVDTSLAPIPGATNASPGGGAITIVQ